MPALCLLSWWWWWWIFVVVKDAATASRVIKRPWKINNRVEDVEDFEEPLFDDALEDSSVSSSVSGVFGWPSYVPKTLNKSTAPLVRGVPIIGHWRYLEPERGRYDFSVITKKLEDATDDGLRAFLMIWIAPDSPDWIFENTSVVTDRSTDKSTSQTDSNRFPDYSDAEFLKCLDSLLFAFKAYFDALNETLRENVVFVQSAEGSTGDAYGYKGDSDDESTMSRTNYTCLYRLRVWERYSTLFDSVPIVFNVNMERMKSAGRFEIDWILQNYTRLRPRLPVFGIKMGMLSHGYHVSHERRRRHVWLDLLKKAGGSRIFSRGEIDKEIAESGWASKNPEQAMYWSALYALHNYLDQWNVPQNLLAHPRYQMALEFFNKYAGSRDPRSSSRGFVAFRRGLDASDSEQFDAESFGPLTKRNEQRYVAIVERHKQFGAVLEDPRNAKSAPMMNRKREGYNDVGWDVLRSSFRRHVYELPSTSATGLWHFPKQRDIYGRFALGLGFEPTKNAIDLAFHPEFGRPDAEISSIDLVYFDRGDAVWRLKVRDGEGIIRTAFTVENGGTDRWLTHQHRRNLKRVPGNDNYTHPLVDIRIERVRGGPVAFHLLEVRLLPDE